MELQMNEMIPLILFLVFFACIFQALLKTFGRSSSAVIALCVAGLCIMAMFRKGDSSELTFLLGFKILGYCIIIALFMVFICRILSFIFKPRSKSKPEKDFQTPDRHESVMYRGRYLDGSERERML